MWFLLLSRVSCRICDITDTRPDKNRSRRVVEKKIEFERSLQINGRVS